MTQQSNPILDRAAANGVSLEMQGAVAVVRLCRPTKRNALNDGLIEGLRDVFQNLPPEAGAAVIHGEGDHFCAGLDLSELKERDAGEGIHHSRGWHVALNAVEQGRVPVVTALHGAVVGGGLLVPVAGSNSCQPSGSMAVMVYQRPSRLSRAGSGSAARVDSMTVRRG